MPTATSTWGPCGELCAREYSFSREDQDAPSRARATAEPARRSRAAERRTRSFPSRCRSARAIRRSSTATRSPSGWTSTEWPGLRPGLRVRRHDHGGECQYPQRRCRGPGVDQREPRRADRRSTDRPIGGARRIRARAGVVHHRAGGGGEGGSLPRRLDGGGHRSLGGQRGLRGRHSGLHEGARARSGGGERARRRRGPGAIRSAAPARASW